MTLSNISKTPIVWSNARLASEAQRSLELFRTRRLAEPATRYPELLAQERRAILGLIRLLSEIDRSNPDPEQLRKVWNDAGAFAALRYVAGPPVSADDLSVLVTASTTKLSKALLSRDDMIAQATLALICQLADESRFPWLGSNRKASFSEIKRAVHGTASLRATQLLATERRSYGREVEKALANTLIAKGFTKVAAPNGGKIVNPKMHPDVRTFYGECTLRGRKTDLFIGLRDGRSVAVEAKDSASVLNSVKRVLNDTAAKAKHWHDKCGEDVVPVALLSGVFGVENLESAQKSGLYLVWTHDLNDFIDWLDAS